MKVVIKRKEKDQKKGAANLAALSKLSQKVKRKELKLKPISRTELVPIPSGPKTKVTLKLNHAGNLRGMHNALNPPDSESMKRIRAMRRFYNKQMPVLQCNGCAFAAGCPQFKAGYECAFLPFLNSHRIDTPQDLINYMKEMAGVSMRRSHLMTLAETLSGATPSLETTEALNIAFEQLSNLHTKLTEGDAEVSVETEDGGILGNLFGGLNNLIDRTRQAQQNPIDVPPVVLLSNNDVDSVGKMDDSKSKANKELILEVTRDEIVRSTGRSLQQQDIQVTNSKK